MMQQKQHSSAVGIQLSSSLSALGNCPEQLHQRLTLPETSLSIQSEWLPERSVWVGAYTGHLIENLPNDCEAWMSRNLRFAVTALQQIEIPL